MFGEVNLPENALKCEIYIDASSYYKTNFYFEKNCFEKESLISLLSINKLSRQDQLKVFLYENV